MKKALILKLYLWLFMLVPIPMAICQLSNDVPVTGPAYAAPNSTQTYTLTPNAISTLTEINGCYFLYWRLVVDDDPVTPSYEVTTSAQTTISVTFGSAAEYQIQFVWYNWNCSLGPYDFSASLYGHTGGDYTGIPSDGRVGSPSGTYAPYSFWVTVGPLVTGDLTFCGDYIYGADTYGAIAATGKVSSGGTCTWYPSGVGSPNTTVENGTILKVIAGESITLGPGFSAKTGAEFNTLITTISTLDHFREAGSDISNTPTASTPLRSDVSVYPNPSSGLFYIDTGSYGGTTGSVEVMNLLGARIQLLEDNATIKASYAVTSDQLPAGTYLVKMAANGGSVVKQIIVRNK